MLTKEMQEQVDAQLAVSRQVAQFYFNKDGVVDGFDSVQTKPEKLPTPLVDLFDSIGQEHAEKIDKAVKLGANLYRSKNGGEYPSANVIATGLLAGLSASQQKVVGFDSVSNGNYEQASIVPALTVVTIASVISNALPIVAMIPNPKKSVLVPIVSVRHTSSTSFGALKAGDYLDGNKAALPYAEGRFRFAMAKTTGSTYKVEPRTQYLSFEDKTPDSNAAKLPFLGANISIRVNGIEVASTVGERDASVQRGQISIKPKPKGVKLGTTTYKVTSGVANLDNRSVEVTFDAELPSGVKLEAFLVADFDAKDANGQFVLTPVGCSIEPEYELIQSVPFVVHVNLSHNVENQLANELGLGFFGTALANMQGKIFLEQNVRLLSEGKERAKLSGRASTFDASRGVAGNLANAANTTADLFSEVIKHIAKGKQQISQASGGATSSFSLYVGDNGAVFFNTLTEDRFKKTGVIATYGEIVKIGTLSDGTSVYHTPTAQGVVNESINSLELALFGNGNEPVKSPFVGTITEPPTVRTATNDTRENKYGLHGNMAAEQNPIDRYAEQVFVINCINMPNL